MTERDFEFQEIADGVWRFAADGGPNSGVIVGDDGVMVVDGQPNAAAAAALAERVTALRAGPVRWLALTHFHASRWAHLDVFPEAAVITSRKCRTELLHRGAGELEVAHLRDSVDIAPGGVMEPPDARLAFKSGLSVFLGSRKVELLHFGRGHTSGDAVAWVQDAGALFTGDLVERGVAPFIGDAAAPDWIATLDRLALYRPAVLAPGRGPAALSGAEARDAFAAQRRFVAEMWSLGACAIEADHDLADALRALDGGATREMRAMPLWKRRAAFAAARLRDVAAGATIPKIWTAERVRAAAAAYRAVFRFA